MVGVSRAIGRRRTVDQVAKIAPLRMNDMADVHRATDEISATVNSLIDRGGELLVRIDSGADLGPRHRINLIAGANVTITAVDDQQDGEVEVTIAASGGGGGFVTDWGTVP